MNSFKTDKFVESSRGDRFVYYRDSDNAIALRCAVEGDPSANDRDQARELRHEADVLSRTGIFRSPPEPADAVFPVDQIRPCLAFREFPSAMQPVRSLAVKLQLQPILFLKFAVAATRLIESIHNHDIVIHGLSPDAFWFDTNGGDALITDLSAASVEGIDAGPPVLSDLSLRYISPEQTLRINRVVDYRTDFYSLGTIFYELLTGRPPFEGTALEVIHAHIARPAIAPTDINPVVSAAVAEIVLKLLAKNPDERYQSAVGLLRDLKECEARIEAGRKLESFELGSGDVSDRLNIPRKLYGRAGDVRLILDAFESVCEDGLPSVPKLLLVSGYSGIGKTALIQELDRPILARKGYFIAGKFDQVARGVPFGATVQAVRGFIKQLLTESDEDLDRWRQRLTTALDSGAAVLAEVVPEIELIVGKQPPPDPLGPNETLNRFQLVVQNFFTAAASPDRPLVLFLDDLQWADPATLGLLQPLLTNSGPGGFMIIGAYRENEVDAAHPLSRALSMLTGSGVDVIRLELGPLERDDVARFVADTLHLPSENVVQLADVVLEKTGGNPFFVIQFLRLLVEEGILRFDRNSSRWVFDTDSLRGASITDNIVDLMTRKLMRLEPATRDMLSIAASIGNRFDTDFLLRVAGGRSADEISSALAEALAEGLVEPSRMIGDIYPVDRDSTPVREYRFLHDRVQQAAYELLAEDAASHIHLHLGRILRDMYVGNGHAEEHLFNAVNHLNLGSPFIDDPAERTGLARLNLAAGRKAMASAAFDSALGYFMAGSGLVNSESVWSDEYDLAFGLHLGAAECEYLTGNFEAAERHEELLLERASSDIDRAAALRQRMLRYENDARYPEAIATAKRALTAFGISFPDSESEKQKGIERELSLIDHALNGRPVSSLSDLPEMHDPRLRMVLEILTDTWSDVYITGDALLARLISATMVRMSLESGNSAASAYGYVTHAITVGPVLGDYAAAGEYGRLALAVNDRFNDKRRRAKINQQFHAHVNLWLEPFADCLPYAREACRSGLEAGDFLYAAYGAMTETWSAILAAGDLRRFVRQYEPSLALIKKLKVQTFADAHALMLGWARALIGETFAAGELSFADFDEHEYEKSHRNNTFFTTFLETARMHVAYILGDPERAFAASERARPIIGHLSGTIWPVLYHFLRGMTAARLNGFDRRSALDELKAASDILRPLAESCPENFLPMTLLIGAETARLEGGFLDAIDGYDRAQSFSAKTGNPQFEALALELSGRFWLDRGRKSVAETFLNDAADSYARWGAVRKVESLSEEFPSLISRPMSRASGRDRDDLASLDVQSVTEAAMAIASEIEFKALAHSLVQIAMTNAGADRGVLLLIDDETSELREVQDQPRDSAGRPFLRSVVNLVHRTGEALILDDALKDPRFAPDGESEDRGALSVMCLPIIHKGRSTGILYLENSVVGGAFSTARVKVCEILAAQAAISLENARLYEKTRREADLRREAEETLRSVMQGTAAVTGDNFFVSLVSHLSASFKAKFAFVTECREPHRERARTLAFWQNDRLVDNIEYAIAGTPCLRVLDGETSFHSDDVQKEFPEDVDLVALGARGFLGVPLYDANRSVIGHIAILDDKPLTRSPQEMSLLAIFAARAGAELERLRAEQELRLAMEEVEQLKDRLAAENVYLQEEIRQHHNFEEIVGDSPALLKVLGQVEQVAGTDATVLIFGETGTGKELIARAIHHAGARAGSPLVKVNCGAISAGLVESELFGHVRGAFTGAMTGRAGRFELANGGTIFLDEVGELPPDTQVKLLRVLQEGEFEPVGSSKTLKTDVRIIAATNRDLQREVNAGRFRSDLFYRLNVFPVRVPPLRERRDDIPLLVMYFLEKFSKKLGKNITSVPAGVMQRLLEYEWSGNIRELQNVIERAVVLAPTGTSTLSSSLLSVPGREELNEIKDAAVAVPEGNGASDIREIERKHILSVLEQTAWVIEGPRGAAQALNLHPNTLRSRLKKLNIQRPATK